MLRISALMIIFIYDELGQPMENRKLPFQQMMHTEALEVFKEWTKSESRKEY